jgi:hypothetical protein
MQVGGGEWGIAKRKPKLIGGFWSGIYLLSPRKGLFWANHRFLSADRAVNLPKTADGISAKLWRHDGAAVQRHSRYYFIILTNSSSLTSTRIASISRAFGEQSQVIIEAVTSTALSAD